ncbi:hypothetical protein EX30DRAFT_118386 [Ascodesmis nigricans]|uniref:Secreted protein n=1 Tax=Ascodesmis nigricans TaxID=341454 RepID=A0A4S2MPQ0_9PEZI|nr:hypothetical protein EX30DRAFT_118386 [Ascodesmis nigricans]
MSRLVLVTMLVYYGQVRQDTPGGSSIGVFSRWEMRREKHTEQLEHPHPLQPLPQLEEQEVQPQPPFILIKVLRSEKIEGAKCVVLVMEDSSAGVSKNHQRGRMPLLLYTFRWSLTPTTAFPQPRLPHPTPVCRSRLSKPPAAGSQVCFFVIGGGGVVSPHTATFPWHQPAEWAHGIKHASGKLTAPYINQHVYPRVGISIPRLMLTWIQQLFINDSRPI